MSLVHPDKIKRTAQHIMVIMEVLDMITSASFGWRSLIAFVANNEEENPKTANNRRATLFKVTCQVNINIFFDAPVFLHLIEGNKA